jgi:hypothetical protein
MYEVIDELLVDFLNEILLDDDSKKNALYYKLRKPSIYRYYLSIYVSIYLYNISLI